MIYRQAVVSTLALGGGAIAFFSLSGCGSGSVEPEHDVVSGSAAQAAGPSPPTVGSADLTTTRSTVQVTLSPPTANTPDAARSPLHRATAFTRRVAPPGAIRAPIGSLSITGPNDRVTTLPTTSDLGGAGLAPTANRGSLTSVSKRGYLVPTPGICGTGFCSQECIDPKGLGATVFNLGWTSIPNPVVYLIYWGGIGPGTAWDTGPGYDPFWNVMANTPSFWNRLMEYGIDTGGSFGGSFGFAGPTGVLTEEQLETAPQAAGFPIRPYSEPGAMVSSDIYVILLPQGTSSLFDQQTGASGHHADWVDFDGVTHPWAVIEFNGSAVFTEEVTSHEITEAATDPDGNSGYTQNGSGGLGEIADPCENQLAYIAGFQVQQIWSEDACRCVREKDLNGIDVSANGSWDFTYFRPSTATWHANGFSPNWHFGLSTDEPFTGDFNGDGRTEFAHLRIGSPSQVETLNILTGIYATHTIGTSGDVAVPGDYDGDGKTDIAVWQGGSLGLRYLSSSDGHTLVTTLWGSPGDIPVPGDYDNDGITDFAVANTSNHQWAALLSSQPGRSLVYTGDLGPGDTVVPGDFDGDGFADFAYFRNTDATWHIVYNNLHGNVGTIDHGVFGYVQQWGQPGDDPVPRDTDSDWLTDLVVWRPSNGHWYSYESSNWRGFDLGAFGSSGDLPMGRPPGP